MLEFREKWISEVMRLTGKDRGYVENIFDTRFRNNDIHIYNSVNSNTHVISAVKYWLNAKNNFVISENGVAFKKANISKSLISKSLDKKMQKRQLFKSLKKKYTNDGDSVSAATAARNESNTKIQLNSTYGAMGYDKGYLFNIDVADSVTSGGRAIIAVSSIVNELLGCAFKFYSLEAHVALINQVELEDVDTLNSKYSLRNVTVEECMDFMLGDYKDGYYAYTFLYNRLSRMSQNALNVLYLKNNLKACIDVPEIHEAVKTVLQLAIDNDSLKSIVDGGIFIAPGVSKESKPHMDYIKEGLRDLCYGLYHFDGDWYEGEYKENPEAIIRSIKRNNIALMDTDSNVTVLVNDKHMIIDKFKDILSSHMDDYDLIEIFIPLMISDWITSLIQKGLRIYGLNLGVIEEDLHKLDLEIEMIMSKCVMTTLKKNYCFTVDVKDYFKRSDFVVKGLKLKKVDSNAEMGDKAEDIILNKIMVDFKDMDYKDLINTIKSETDRFKKEVTSLEFLKDKKTVLKLGNPMSFGDHRMKAVNLWNKIYPDQQIPIPGAFGVVRVDFTDEFMNKLKNDRPAEYEAIMKFVDELILYKTYSYAVKKIHDIPVSILTKSSVEIFNNFKKILLNIDPKAFEMHIDEFSKSMDTMVNHDGLNDTCKDLGLLKINKVTDILKSCSKLAVPQDIAVMPDILSIYDKELFDISTVTEFENMLSPIVRGISIISPKNKEQSSKRVITNILHADQ